MKAPIMNVTAIYACKIENASHENVDVANSENQRKPKNDSAKFSVTYEKSKQRFI